MPDLTARAILVANQTLSGAFTTPDGVALANGDRVLAAGQTSSADNGFYTVAAGAWSRDGTVTYTRSMDIRILDGSEYGMSRWVYTAISSPTLGTTPLTFAQETKVPRSGAGSGLEEVSGSFRLPQRVGVPATIEVGPLSMTHTDRGIMTSLAAGFGRDVYIEGLIPTWTNSTSVTVSPGAGWIPDPGSVEEIAAALIMNSSPSMLQNFEYVYLQVSPLGGGTLYKIATAPGAPYAGTARAASADNTLRYVMALHKKDAGALFSKFVWNLLSDKAAFVRYLEDVAASPFLVLNGGAAQTETTVSCSSVVPPTSRIAKIRVQTNGSAGVVLGNSEDTLTLSSTAFLEKVSSGQNAEIDMPLDVNQAFTWRNIAASGSTDISVLGYYERR